MGIACSWSSRHSWFVGGVLVSEVFAFFADFFAIFAVKSFLPQRTPRMRKGRKETKSEIRTLPVRQIPEESVKTSDILGFPGRKNHEYTRHVEAGVDPGFRGGAKEISRTGV
jgi:hypothetical protein